MNNQQINLSELASVDIQKVSKEDLVDVSSLHFDSAIPPHLRAAYILKATGNPYCFRVGELGVKLEFTDDAPPLQDAFSDLLQRKRSGL